MLSGKHTSASHKPWGSEFGEPFLMILGEVQFLFFRRDKGQFYIHLYIPTVSFLQSTQGLPCDPGNICMAPMMF